MGAIGGLDVAYGAQLQIVRTNVLLVEVTSNNVTENGGKNVLELARQGLPAMLKPDMIYCTDDADADIEDVGWSAATIFKTVVTLLVPPQLFHEHRQPRTCP